MFGPNVKSDFNNKDYYHHREEKFHNILQELEKVFVKKFGLDNYAILFLTGSGTTANEAVIFSYKYRFEIWYDDAEFGRRLLRLTEAHKRNDLCSGTKGIAFPLYETSISRYNLFEQYYFEKDLIFLDMVSAFPFYMPPKNTAIWSTVSSKQLGAFPVLGIVAIRKDLLHDGLFNYISNSSLSLTEHLRFREKQETQATPAIPLFVDLLYTLKHFNRVKFRQKIEGRRKRIVEIVGRKNIIGTGPVITLVNKKWFVPIAEKFNLYKNGGGNYQIFLWSGSNFEYNELYKALRKI